MAALSRVWPGMVADPLFITGGSGLLALNWALTRRAYQRVVLGLHERTVVLRGVDTEPADLAAVAGLTRRLAELAPGLVVHAAALTDVELCEAQPALAHHVNVQLALNVAQACARTGVRLVYISTDHLFAGAAPFIDEQEPPAPRNAYARSKGEGERVVVDACPDALIVRTNFYCWGPPYRASFSDRILQSLRAGRELTLFTDVYYTPVLAQALVDSVHAAVAKGATGVLNVGSEDRVSKYEFGMLLAQQFGLDASLIRSGALADRPDLADRPREMSLSTDRLRALLGRPPGTTRAQVAQLQELELAGLAQELQQV